MRVCILTVPYDSGRRGERMGAGPLELIDRGLEPHLEGLGHQVTQEGIELDPATFPIEVQAAFELNRRVAERVREAVGRGELPLILSGNCNAAVGSLAGVGSEGTGLTWFDAHGDINTPETTPSGYYLDGMGVAMALGWCWREVVASLPGFAPLAEESTVLLSVGDLDPGESRLVEESRVVALSPSQVRSDLSERIEELAERVDGVYVHLDPDGPQEAEPLSRAPPGEAELVSESVEG